MSLTRECLYAKDNNSDFDRLRGSSKNVTPSEAPHDLFDGPLQGHFVRRMFSDIEADAYVMADGDATYDPTAAEKMIDLLISQRLDMAVGRRVHRQPEAYRTGHVCGNKILTTLLALLFERRFSKILSGYRVFRAAL